MYYREKLANLYKQILIFSIYLFFNSFVLNNYFQEQKLSAFRCEISTVWGKSIGGIVEFQ